MKYQTLIQPYCNSSMSTSHRKYVLKLIDQNWSHTETARFEFLFPFMIHSGPKTSRGDLLILLKWLK